MVNINLFDFKVLLKSTFHPLTPVFVGSWRGQFSTKWRGISAELSYNTYLRNGWVVIDTGVKSETGTPIVEFSSWEPYVSHANIIVPNILSYKFFFKKAFWRVGFLTRTSVVANEEWVGSLPAYLSVYNNTKRGGFIRKNNRNFFLNSKPLFFFVQRFLFFKSAITRTFYDAKITFTQNLLGFNLFENLVEVNRRATSMLSSVSCLFETIIIGKRAKLGVFAYSNKVAPNLFKVRNFSLQDTLFKLAILFLLNVVRGTFAGFKAFFFITLRALISDCIFLIIGSVSFSKSIINFFFKKFIILFENSNLNFTTFLRVSGYTFSILTKLLRGAGGKQVIVSDSNRNLAYDLVTFKLQASSFALVYQNAKNALLLNSAHTPLQDFLQGFAPRFFIKKRMSRTPFTKHAAFFTRKTSKFSNKGTTASSVVGSYVYPRLIKYRRKPATRFKFSSYKKQFSFLHFWVINFFAFFSLKPSSSKQSSWIAARLKFFFRLFLKFLKFYSFTSDYFSLSFAETFRQRARFLIKFNSLRLYFWFLLKRVRGLLSAFWSFSSKLSRNYTVSANSRMAAVAANFSRIVLKLAKPLGLIASSQVRRLVASPRHNTLREVKGLRSAFLSLHSGLFAGNIDSSTRVILKIRTFLQFTLLIRRAVFYYFTGQLNVVIRSALSEVSLNSRHDLRVSQLLQVIIKNKLFHIFFTSRKNFNSLICYLRQSYSLITKYRKKSVRSKLSLVAVLGKKGLPSFSFTAVSTALFLLRRLVLRRAKGVRRGMVNSFRGALLAFTKISRAGFLRRSQAAVKNVLLEKNLARSLNYTNSADEMSRGHYFLHNIDYLTKAPLASESVSFLTKRGFYKNSSSSREFKLAYVKVRFFLFRFSDAQLRMCYAPRTLSRLRVYLNTALLSSLYLENTEAIGRARSQISEFGLLIKHQNFLALNSNFFTSLNIFHSQYAWISGVFGLHLSALHRVVAAFCVQRIDYVNKISFLTFFTQLRIVAKTIARRINYSKFEHCDYYIRPHTPSAPILNKINLNRINFLANTFYSLSNVSFTVKLESANTLKLVSGGLFLRHAYTTSNLVWQNFLLRFLPFLVSRCTLRKIVTRARSMSLASGVPIFGSRQKNLRVTFMRRHKKTRSLKLGALNLHKCVVNLVNLRQLGIFRRIKYFLINNNQKMLPRVIKSQNSYVISKKLFTLNFVKKVLAESVNCSSILLNHPDRMQETVFRKVRAIRKILLRSNARRLGIFPKRNKHLKKMYWKLVNSGKLEPVSPDYLNAQRSIFDRRNRSSMELSAQRAKRRFRFTTVKLQFTVKKQLWSQLILLLEHIKKVMRVFRVKIWKRRFYRLFRAGRWAIRKKLKKRFIRLIVKAGFFLQKARYLLLPANALAFTKRAGTLTMHNTHNSYILLRSFYLRVFSQVTVKYSGKNFLVRHAFFKEAKLNFIYKFIYWFFKKIAGFLLNLRSVYLNFTYFSHKISALALTGAVNSWVFSRNPRLAANLSTSYGFSNAVLFTTDENFQTSFGLVGRMTSSAFVIFSENARPTTLISSPLSAISDLFVRANAFFVWKRTTAAFKASSLSWTFLLNRRVSALKVGRFSVFLQRNFLAKSNLRRFSLNNANLLKLRRLNLAINMRPHPYAKLLERISVTSRTGLKGGKPRRSSRNLTRAKVKFFKRGIKLVNRAANFKRAFNLVR